MFVLVLVLARERHGEKLKHLLDHVQVEVEQNERSLFAIIFSTFSRPIYF